MPIFIVDYDPKKSALKNGAVPLAIAIDAKSKKLAEMSATMKMEEEFPGASDNFFKPRVTEDAIGSPRPALNKFDEVFPKENEVVDGVWRRIEAQTQANDLVDFSALSLREKIAAFALYAQAEITEHEFSMVCDYLDLPDGDGDADADTDKLIRVLSDKKSLKNVTDELLLNVVNSVNAQFPSIADAPEHEILAFVDTLITTPEETNAPEKKLSITGLDRERQYTHTYAMLDKEVAAALVRDAEDCWELTADHVRESNVLINQNGEEFQRWSTELRMAENALKIPRPIVFALVSAGKKRPELLKDANARRQFVVDFLAEHVQSEIKVESMSDGRFSIDGLMGESASNQGEKTEVVSATSTPEAETKQTETVKPPTETITQQDSTEAGEQVISDSTAQQAKEALDQLGYGVYATETEAPAPAPAESYQATAEYMGKYFETLSDDASKDNLAIWKSVQKTEPAFVKKNDYGAGLHSIKAQYVLMRATETFGPEGIGWGVDVIEERLDKGVPMMEPLQDQSGKVVGHKPVRDGAGDLLCLSVNTMRIELWYMWKGQRGVVTAYGHTDFLSKDRNGNIVMEKEASKKTLTDATTKALSHLGFSADVYMDMYNDPNYTAEIGMEFAIKKASDKAEDVVRMRTELDEKFTKNAATLENAVNVNEVNRVFGTIARELGVHLKDAEAKGDTEHAKYLSGRLRRLTQIKNERTAALEANQGETA